MTPSRSGHILLVEDETAFRTLCAGWLRDLGHRVTEAATPTEALARFRQSRPDLVVLDLVMPPEHSVEAGLERIGQFAEVPVIVTTGHADRENALTAIERGAWDFLGKPLDPDLLRIVIGRALEKRALEAELQRLRADQGAADDLGILGASPAIRALRELIRRIAPTDINALVLGPSGTGKELAARALHRLGARQGGPFVAVHCGAIPENLLESELFGHAKGSFTGADRDRIGLIESAAGGTLFLDEIGEMSLTMQVKLLRFLQEGRVRPVGGRDDRPVDPRVVCATHRDLAGMVEAGAFREDLYYRIKGVILRTPSLSERIEDISLLAQAFLNRLSDGQRVYRLAPSAMSWLIAHGWPGNVRELQNLLRSAAALAQPGLQLESQAGSRAGSQAGSRAGPQAGSSLEAKPTIRPEGGAVIIGVEELLFAYSGQPTPQPAAQGGPASLEMAGQMAALEKRLILTALAETGGNHSQAARLLGISRVGLWKKMKRLGLGGEG